VLKPALPNEQEMSGGGPPHMAEIGPNG